MVTPKLPPFMLRLFDNILFKILVMFLILYITFNYPPTVALVVSIVVAILFMVINLLKVTHDQMASISGNHMEGVPVFSPTKCSQNTKVPDGLVGEHGESIFEPTNEQITGMPDAEIESLCMHIKKDKNATDVMETSTDFSEVFNTKEACEFAKHQYKTSEPNVPCSKAENVEGNVQPFSPLAQAI